MGKLPPKRFVHEQIWIADYQVLLAFQPSDKRYNWLQIFAQ